MKTTYISILVATAMLFVSCGSDDGNSAEVNDGRVLFSSGGNTTKVGGTDGDQWEGNENIGIYMVGNTDQAIKEGAKNIQYTTASGGASVSFTPANNMETIYYPVDAAQKVDFIAYHPYNTSVSNYIYPVDVSNQSNQSALDLMRAVANNSGAGYDKTQGSNNIKLVFDHRLTKVIFNVEPGEGLVQADLNNMTVTIKELPTKADYVIDTDNLTPDVTSIKGIMTKPTTAGSFYEAIVIPTSFAADEVTVEFALNNAPKNEVFVYKVPATNFLAGEKHTFNVKVQRTKVEVTGTIDPWETGAISPGTAK